MNYSFRQALDADAFLQLPLVGHDKFRREANERGIRLSLGHRLVEQLEELDEVGALRPIAFSHPNREEIVVREETEFRQWAAYGIGAGAGTAQYSPWQLLYLRDALELGTTTVPAQWFLREDGPAPASPQFVEWLEL